MLAFIFLKAQNVSFFINGHTDDVPLFMSSKLITDIKAGNKVVLITLTASDEGKGTTSFNGSAVPFYVACEKGLVFATKFSYDISINNSIALTPTLQTVNINGHNITKYVYKNSINYFLRLPDGGNAGAGYALTGNVSLQKLSTGAISSINALGASASYFGWNDIVNTIKGIITVENGTNGTYINCPSINTSYNPSDNSDHFYAGLAAQNAVSTFSWAGVNEFVGNHSSNLSSNLSSGDFLNCSGILSAYNFSLIENRYSTKFINSFKAYLPMDYFNVLKTPNSCNTVSGLNITNITGSTATINWGGVAGSIGYDVDYKLNSSAVWINAATSTAATSVNLSGLAAGNLYDYRIRRKCSVGNSGYATATFTTTAPTTCNAPTGLNNSNITATSATVAWAVVGNAISYQLEYKSNAASTWTIVNSSLALTSATISGLTAASIYQWRVKANCSAGLNSTYSNLEFTTLNPLGCAAPANTVTSAITTNSAIFSWNAVSGVSNYTVEYKLTSAASWIVLSAALTGTSITASGLQTSTSYDWRVKTNCSNGVISVYSTATFTTSAALSCATPANNVTSAITANSAIFSWNTVSGVSNYTVEYKLTSAASWIVLSAALNGTSITASGLLSNTNYDWRVKANCSNGVISLYSTAAFITSNVSTACNKPENLYVTNVSSNKCTFNWDAVAGATGYTIQFRQFQAANWSTPASNINAVSYTLTGLNYYTIYEWRIVSNCSNGSTNPSDVFIVLTSCIDFNEPNNNTALATLVDVGSVSSAQITAVNDVDYYKFTTVTAETNLSIDVFDLPADYNLNLYNAAGQLLASSANTGTAAEQIIYNTTVAGTYYFSIAGSNGSFDSTQCYVYALNTSGAAMSTPAIVSDKKGASVIAGSNSKVNKTLVTNKVTESDAQKFVLFPQPAADKITIKYKSEKMGSIVVRITDVNGNTVQQNRITINAGSNNINLNILKHPSGIYLLSLWDGKKITTQKLVISR